MPHASNCTVLGGNALVVSNIKQCSREVVIPDPEVALTMGGKYTAAVEAGFSAVYMGSCYETSLWFPLLTAAS